MKLLLLFERNYCAHKVKLESFIDYEITSATLKKK